MVPLHAGVLSFDKKKWNSFVSGSVQQHFINYPALLNITTCFTREIASLEAGERISKYWTGYERKEIYSAFDEVMGKVRKRRVPKWDSIES